ncbi:hypothetical protein B296_00015474 [Ensete ventricosum]|uniref:Uncharacterized protein n=1 Tax=Ensete ventricosum TaxID=4639 RepID=A0A426ZPP5_ENSVE|nr:hypothetical protein B296_00015474 [Ensete ventricosum]
MGSRNYTQQLGLGSGRSAGSSRRGKKNNMERPKQPQRGLGVAQLEKIIFQNKMMGSYPSPLDCDLEKVFLDDNHLTFPCLMFWSLDRVVPSCLSSSRSTMAERKWDIHHLPLRHQLPPHHLRCSIFAPIQRYVNLP